MTEEQKMLADSAVKLLDRTLAFIPRVDNRAQVLLGLDLGAVLTLALNVPSSKLLEWTAGVGAIAVAMFGVSLWHLYRCAFPQLIGGSNSLVYFREIARLREAEFIERTMSRDIDAYIKDVLAQVWRNAQITTAKFEALEQAMRWFGLAIPVWLVSLVLFVAETNRLALK